MAFIQPSKDRHNSNPVRDKSLAERIAKLEEEKTFAQRSLESQQNEKPFKWWNKWGRKFRASNKNKNSEQILVVFLNKKNEIETPKFMSIYDGNMVIYKNKAYEFDPRAIWRVKGAKGNPQAYLIKEIDRRPVRNKFGDIVYKDSAVSNMDIEEVRQRGDSTESDEFLIKAALKAQKENAAKKMNVAIMIIVGIIVVGALIYFLAK